jgi:Mg2+ and Co2+ transporter CorA
VPHRAADRETALEIAERIAGSPQRRTWRRVTTLLDDFDVFALTPDVRERLDGALGKAGVRVDPPLTTASRHDTVRLTMAADDGHSGDDLPRVSDLIQATVWRPGERPVAVALEDADPAEGIVWFDVNMLLADEDSVCELVLPQTAGQLTREIVADLLDADPRPKVVHYGEQVRAVSTLRVEAHEPTEGGEDPAASKAGLLVFQVVEIAAGDGWLMTTRHKAGIYRGAHEEGRGDPADLAALRDAGERRWLAAGGRTSGDLGIALMHELASSYRNAHRELYAWLESWELDFDERGSQTEQLTLKELRGLTALLRVRLTSLQRPEREAADAWVTGVTDVAAAELTSELIERSLRQLREISDGLRSSLDILVSSNAQDQRRQGARLEQRLTLITSVLLVPTLVVGLYGANTKLPGRDTWEGFWIMVLLCIASALGSFFLIRAVRGGDRDAER